jgi:hypothetical protein
MIAKLQDQRRCVAVRIKKPAEAGWDDAGND